MSYHYHSYHVYQGKQIITL